MSPAPIRTGGSFAALPEEALRPKCRTARRQQLRTRWDVEPIHVYAVGEARDFRQRIDSSRAMLATGRTAPLDSAEAGLRVSRLWPLWPST